VDTLVIIVVVVFLVILFGVVIRLFASMTQVVPQTQRLVVYRLGRFHRIAGPGPVQIIPRLDQVVRMIEVRDHPVEITVPGLFAFGAPNTLTLNLWCSFDLVQAAEGDHGKLAQLVQLSESERHQQVEVKMREALVRQIADLQQKMPLPDKATLMDRIIALAPASPRHNALLKGVKYDLERTLPSVGVILNTNQPIVLTGRSLSDEITEAIQRRRGRELDSEWLLNYADTLRERFPGISDAMLAQILTSIEGVDVGNIQRLLLEHERNTETEVEFEMPGDGSGVPNVIIKPKTKAQQPPPTGTEGKPARTPRPLTKSDLAVLKR
jgi:hypothetical protein